MIRNAVLACFLGLYSMNTHADDIKDLCQHDIEGTYLGTLGGIKLRVNLICLTDDNLSATVCPAIDNAGTFGIDTVTNLGWAAVEGGKLIIANFALDNASRPSGSSKSIVSYLEISLSALYSGRQLKGAYMTGGMTEFQSVDAKRIKRFPKIIPIAKARLDADTVGGVFRTDVPGDNEGTNLVFNNLLGTPVVSIVGVSTRLVIHFSEGPLWDTSGVFSSATAEGNGGEPDDKKLNSIRGRFSDADHVEFYLINSVLGLRGPYHGTRIPGSLAPNPKA